ncbi:MAG: DUF4163 domain-containing protein [Chitinophagales bacterium]|nr:DUF3298 and DUF4163 domain-containing protein [Candidatus Calescibacterium sp.]MDW8274601.1 DUF4163 domain-containing protein [Chitinophagales bacterium]
MVRKILFSLICFFSIYSCKQQKLSYVTKHFELKDTQCKSKNCTSVNFQYVYFEGENADTLNKVVDEYIGASFVDDSLVKQTPEQAAQAFIEMYREVQKEFPDADMPWYLKRKLMVDTQFNNIITLEYSESSYTGGAHGSYFTQYNSYQLKPFKILWIGDFLLNPKDTSILIKIAESVFREDQKLGAYDNLEEAGFFFENGIFRLNDNFHFTSTGLEFHFNIYEIQPYAMGEYKLLIPYNKIDNLLNKSMLQPL